MVRRVATTGLLGSQYLCGKPSEICDLTHFHRHIAPGTCLAHFHCPPEDTGLAELVPAAQARADGVLAEAYAASRTPLECFLIILSRFTVGLRSVGKCRFCFPECRRCGRRYSAMATPGVTVKARRKQQLVVSFFEDIVRDAVTHPLGLKDLGRLERLHSHLPQLVLVSGLVDASTHQAAPGQWHALDDARGGEDS